jgi:glycosyltransferase involved in cell wall biosynthesis
MKIQIIGHADEKDPKTWRMRWHRLPVMFEERGHKVDHILIRDWNKFYFRYLKFKPDVLITCGLIGSMPALLKKLKLLCRPLVHDWNDSYTDVMGRRYGIDRVAFLEHFIIKNSEFITTPSRYLERKCELFGKNAIYIPHGVNPDFMDGEPKKLDGKVKVLYLGSQNEYKMADKIISSVKDMECDLYLLGKINEKFRESAPKNAHFLGEVDNQEVSKYLRGADILVFAADDDSTTKMFEYMKAGKAILALKGRPGYVLDNNVNALLVDDLREGLKQLIENEDLRKRLGENLKKVKIYTWNEIADMYLKFLETTVVKG